MDDGSATDPVLDDLLAHLVATAERPVDPRVNRWLGEAEAVARDAATADLDPETTRERVGHVARLLDEAGPTGDEAADEHVVEAKACCRALLDD